MPKNKITKKNEKSDINLKEAYFISEILLTASLSVSIPAA